MPRKINKIQTLSLRKLFVAQGVNHFFSKFLAVEVGNLIILNRKWRENGFYLSSENFIIRKVSDNWRAKIEILLEKFDFAWEVLFQYTAAFPHSIRKYFDIFWWSFITICNSEKCGMKVIMIYREWCIYSSKSWLYCD